MHLFWTPIIEPILKLIQAKMIVEIGADSGLNTKNILKYCRESHATCEIIDPLEIGNIEEIRSDLTAFGKQRKDLSLNILPRLELADVYLIDGDHNWYTVYNELKLIFEKASSRQRRPMIFFHDVEWPYARRDLYYNAKTIPTEFIHPISTLGLEMDNGQTSAESGINFGLGNAAEEGGAKNGVLTAVEDAIDDLNLEESYRFLKIPVNHGLGVLMPARYYPSDVEGKILANLTLTPGIEALFRAVERDRVSLMSQSEKFRNLVVAKHDLLLNNTESILNLNSVISGVSAEKERLATEAANLKSELDLIKSGWAYRVGNQVRKTLLKG